MRQKINKAIARELLWDNAVYLMNVVKTAIDEKNSDGKQNDFDVDGIIIAMEWLLGQLLYLKHGRKYEARLLLYKIEDGIMIAFDKQPEVFKSCENIKKYKAQRANNKLNY